MDNNATWVIALDQSAMDNDVIKYTAGLCQILTPQKIIFISVLRDKKSYPFVPEEYLDFMNQVEMDLKLTMAGRVEKEFDGLNTQTECRVEYGNPFQEIINLVMNQTASLVVAGRKKVSGGSGVISDRLSRNLPCDILLVPEDKKFELNNLLITTDFSEHSELALKKALRFKHINDKINIIAFNGYEVPMGYSKSGKSFDEFAGIIRSNVDKEMKRWTSQHSLKIEPILVLKKDKSFADLVMETAVEKSVDMIIMGSKGQTAASLAMLGSSTMKVIMKNYEVPLLIVKKPNENIDFFNALKRL